MRTNEIKNQIDEIKKWEEKGRRKDWMYKTNKYKYSFQQYDTISPFRDSIYNGKISINEAGIDQSSLLDGLTDFNDRSRPKTAEGKNKKENTYKSANAFYEGRVLILNAFRSRIFSIKERRGKGLKILIPQQMLQRSPIALSQVKARNTSENFFNKIRQIIYALYRSKEITKKVYRHTINLIKA